MAFLVYNLDFDSDTLTVHDSDFTNSFDSNAKLVQQLKQSAIELDTSEIATKYLLRAYNRQIDSLQAVNFVLSYVKTKLKPAAVAGTSYVALKELNNLDPERFKKLIRTAGANPKFISKVPEKWGPKWASRIKGSKRILVGVIISSGAMIALDESGETSIEKKVILAILVFCSGYFFYQYLQKREIVS